MSNVWRKRGIFWAGTLGASLWSGLAFAVTLAAIDLLPENSLWGQIFAIGFGLVSLIAIFYGAGIIATFFWVTVAENVEDQECAAWRTGTLMLIFAPIVVLSAVGLLFVLLLGFPMSWFFRRGMIFGEDFWKQRRWRRLFGLTNSWQRDAERDGEQKSSDSSSAARAAFFDDLLERDGDFDGDAHHDSRRDD